MRKIAKCEEKKIDFLDSWFSQRDLLVPVKQESSQSQKEAQWEQQRNVQYKQLAHFSKFERQILKS